MIDKELFERLIAEEFGNAVPKKFQSLIENVAFLAEDEPDEAIRREHGLGVGETLLGLYRGVSRVNRGDWYGVGGTLPDTIVLYRLPLCEEAAYIERERGVPFEAALRQAIRETIWHEVAHHFGFNEEQVRDREERDGKRR